MKILMVAYDNNSFLTWFPQGLGYLATVARDKGHYVKIYHQDIYHWEDSHLTNYLDENRFDIVILSIIGGYYQYEKLLKISNAINNSKSRRYFHYLLGGHGPASDPDYFLLKTKADAIVIGEGEITFEELLDAIEFKKPFNTIDGIAFLMNSEVVKTRKRDLIQDLDKIGFPAWDLFNIDYYALLRMPNISNTDRSFPVLSGRGCPFECNFCFRLDKGFRPRNTNSIIDEIKLLHEKYQINYIIFSDELLMSSKERTIEISNAIKNLDFKIKWECNGRLNYADEDVLKVMKESGCVFINYGIESLDDKTLKVMSKALTKEMIIRGVENTIKSGISPGLNIIYGNINEPLSAIDEAVEFLIKYDDHSQLRTIRPVTAYPGTPLFNFALNQNLVNDTEDFYENLHKNSDLISINFTKHSENEIYEKLNWANSLLISKYIDVQKDKMVNICNDLYLNKNSKFRGFRQT